MITFFLYATLTSSTKKEVAFCVPEEDCALKLSVTSCPAYFASRLLALKVTCCQLCVASVLHALCTFPIALPLLSNTLTVKVSSQLCEVLVVVAYHQ